MFLCSLSLIYLNTYRYLAPFNYHLWSRFCCFSCDTEHMPFSCLVSCFLTFSMKLFLNSPFQSQILSPDETLPDALFSFGRIVSMVTNLAVDYLSLSFHSRRRKSKKLPSNEDKCRLNTETDEKGLENFKINDMNSLRRV